MRIVNPPKFNNKGLSLVELIIAFSIGVIVAGTIATLIVFTIRTYHNESVNTSTQYEIQTNINMLMDEIMGASAFVVEQNNDEFGGALDPNVEGEPYTKFAMFGTPNTDGAGKFKGVIFASSPVTDGRFEIYMKKVDKTIPYNTSEGIEIKDIKGLAGEEYKILSTDGDHTEYLLGENATQFVIIPDPNDHSFGSYVDSHGDTQFTYKNPIEIQVELKFEKAGWGSKVYSKRVDEITYLRNRVSDTIYVKGTERNLESKVGEE